MPEPWQSKEWSKAGASSGAASRTLLLTCGFTLSLIISAAAWHYPGSGIGSSGCWVEPKSKLWGGNMDGEQPPNKHSFTMTSSDVLWWSIILVPPSFWIFQYLNVSIVLYVVGALASAVFGSLSWISIRYVIIHSNLDI